MLRILGRLFLLGALLGALGELFSIELPTVRFPFSLSREIGFLHANQESGNPFPWFGWLATFTFLGIGIFIEPAQDMTHLVPELIGHLGPAPTLDSQPNADGTVRPSPM